MTTRLLKYENKSKFFNSTRSYNLDGNQRNALRYRREWIRIDPETYKGTIEKIQTVSSQRRLFEECCCNNPNFEYGRISRPKIKDDIITQICIRCSHHYRLVWKNGHGNVCPFKDCPCTGCKFYTDYLANHLKNVQEGRKRKQEKNYDTNSDSRRPSVSLKKRKIDIETVSKLQDPALELSKKVDIIKEATTAAGINFNSFIENTIATIWIEKGINDKPTAGCEIIHPYFPTKMFSEQEIKILSKLLNDFEFIKNDFRSSSVFLILKDDSEFTSMIKALQSSGLTLIVMKPRLRSTVVYSSILNLVTFDEQIIRSKIQRFNDNLNVSLWRINEMAKVIENEIKVNFEVDLASSIVIENNHGKINCEMGKIDLELKQLPKLDTCNTIRSIDAMEEEFINDSRTAAEKYIRIPQQFLSVAFGGAYETVELIEWSVYIQHESSKKDVIEDMDIICENTIEDTRREEGKCAVSDESESIPLQLVVYQRQGEYEIRYLDNQQLYVSNTSEDYSICEIESAQNNANESTAAEPSAGDEGNPNMESSTDRSTDGIFLLHISPNDNHENLTDTLNDDSDGRKDVNSSTKDSSFQYLDEEISKVFENCLYPYSENLSKSEIQEFQGSSESEDGSTDSEDNSTDSEDCNTDDNNSSTDSEDEELTKYDSKEIYIEGCKPEDVVVEEGKTPYEVLLKKHQALIVTPSNKTQRFTNEYCGDKIASFINERIDKSIYPEIQYTLRKRGEMFIVFRSISYRDKFIDLLSELRLNGRPLRINEAKLKKEAIPWQNLIFK